MKRFLWFSCISSMLLLILACSIYANDTYEPFAVPLADIQAVLMDEFVFPVDNNVKLPADISFACADIKYKNGELKFCECGDGVYMSFRTACVVLNNHKQDVVSPYWGIFWYYLKQFNLPIWHVDDCGAQNAMSLEVLTKLGGKHVGSLKQLELDPLFKSSCKKDFKKVPSIADYAGIVVYRAKKEKNRDCDMVNRFKNKHPEFLFVNDIVRDYVKRKDNTYNLFADAQLNDFIPKFNVYRAVYSSTLAEQVLRDIPSDPLVIKPVYASLACGVNVVERKNLDSFLKLILRDTYKIDPYGHRCYTYWRKYKPTNFFASEYAPSKVIYKDGKPYDPTMRVVFMMHHNQGEIHVTVIAGFWKIPVKSLLENVSLTEKHVTIAHAGSYYSGILANKKDWKEIKSILEIVLSKLYVTMLGQHVH